MEQWLNGVNEWTLWMVLLAALQGSAALGFHLARLRKTGANPPESRSEVSAIQGTVLGLLALLLGFAFSMASQRFEDRKLLIRNEANAIGTLGLRIQLLPELRRARFTQLLLDYTDTRFALQKQGFEPELLRVHHARAGQLQDQMWAEAMAVANVAPESVTISLFVASLNDMIDLHGMQMAAIRNRIPSAIFVMLFLVALVALALTGYGSTLPHRQRIALTFLLSSLFSSVMILTIDLHRPGRGLATVSLTSLDEARESLRHTAKMGEPRRSP